MPPPSSTKRVQHSHVTTFVPTHFTRGRNKEDHVFQVNETKRLSLSPAVGSIGGDRFSLWHLSVSSPALWLPSAVMLLGFQSDLTARPVGGLWKPMVITFQCCLVDKVRPSPCSNAASDVVGTQLKQHPATSNTGGNVYCRFVRTYDFLDRYREITSLLGPLFLEQRSLMWHLWEP